MPDSQKKECPPSLPAWWTAIFILALFFAFYFSSITIEISFFTPKNNEVASNWIYSYQSLIGGILALIAGGGTVLAVRAQTKKAHEQEENRVKAIQEGLFFTLPITIFEFQTYAEATAKTIYRKRCENKSMSLVTDSIRSTIETEGPNQRLMNSLQEASAAYAFKYHHNQETSLYIQAIGRQLQLALASSNKQINDLSSFDRAIGRFIVLACMLNRLYDFARKDKNYFHTGPLSENEKQQRIRTLMLSSWLMEPDNFNVYLDEEHTD